MKIIYSVTLEVEYDCAYHVTALPWDSGYPLQPFLPAIEIRVQHLMSKPSLPSFDESTRAEKLALEAFKWLNQATNYIRSSAGGIDEVYNALKLVLRLIAVRNPNSQSLALRNALGHLIEAICQHENSEKVCLDLLGLLIRMVDAKQDNKYNPMKLLAISGLGHLSPYLKIHMRQMSVNVFIVCIDSLKVCPQTPETLLYRNCILWTMGQSATPSVDELSLKVAVKLTISMIESADKRDPIGIQTLVNAFDLLTVMLTFPKAKYLEKKLDGLHHLFLNHGCTSSNAKVRRASAQFYCTALLSFNDEHLRHNIQGVVHAILKSMSHHNWGKNLDLSTSADSHLLLLGGLLNSQADSAEFESRMDEWLASLLLQLDPNSAQNIITDIIIRHKKAGKFDNIDIVGVLLRQLALAQVPALATKTKSSRSAKVQTAKPLVESTFACLSATVSLLGSSAQPVASAIHQATLGYLFNTNNPLSNEQRVWAISCLVSVVEASPPLLITTLEMCLKQLEMSATPTTGSRLIDLAYALAATVALSKQLGMYSDHQLIKRITLIGTGYIKQGENLKIYSAGWTLLCGVFTLGSQVTRPLVSQFLLIWESHLAQANQLLMEQCLNGLLIFLAHNKPLLTPDVSVRLGNVLNLLWTVLEKSPSSVHLRRRFLQCFDLLLDGKRLDNYPSSLLVKYVAHVSNSRSYSKETGVVMESAMVLTQPKRKADKDPLLSTIQLESIWEPTNVVEFGLSSFESHRLPGNAPNDLEYFLFFQDNNAPQIVYTTIVDLAISICSKLLPFQPTKIQESVFDAILYHLEFSLKISSLRKAAVMLNTANLMSQILKNESNFDEGLLKVILSILKLLLGSPYSEARQLAAESLGDFATSLKHDQNGSSMITSLTKELLENAVGHHLSLDLRSGSIKALGFIAEKTPQTVFLDAIYRLLMPLAADPEPLIHTAILEAMQRTLMSSEFIDPKYVRHTLKAVRITYLLESHSKYLEFQVQAAKTLVQTISRFGPLLSADSFESNRQYIVCMADQLQLSSFPQVRVLAFKAFIELYYYARQGVLWQLFVKRWKEIICDPQSLDEEVDAAVNGLLILIRLSARSMFSVAGPGLNDALWLLLDKRPEHAELKSLFKSWISQTANTDHDISQWIQNLSNVVMKPRYFFERRLARTIGVPKDNGTDHGETVPRENLATVSATATAADEEVSLGIASDDSAGDQFSWHARQFALELLLDLLRLDLKDKDDEAKANSITTKLIGDLIKLSFSSSTSRILELRLSGLNLLSEIVEQVGSLADPDFAQISLLEQYQVQITSAVGPAFDRDSSPDVALAALRTCSSFLTSNILKTKEKLGRLTKILEESLESVPSTFKLGSLEMGADAQIVIKMALLTVWADLKISDRDHLLSFVDVHEKILSDHWTEAIFIFGTMSAGLETQWTPGSIESAIDQMTDAQYDLLIQPVIKSSWLKFIKALSLDLQEGGKNPNSESLIIMCSLCYQALTSSLQNTKASYGDNLSPNDESTEYRLAILETLGSLLTPNTCRTVVESNDDYFENTTPLLYRSMLVGKAEEQICVLKIAQNLVSSQVDTDENVSHLFELLKIAILPLRYLFPQLNDPDARQEQDTVKLDLTQRNLLRSTMNTVIEIAQHFRETIKTDLWVCLLKAFEELNHQIPEVAAPSFKLLLEILANQANERGIGFIVGTLNASLKRAVETPDTTESLLISTAIVCTNWKSLCSRKSLKHIYQFGLRAASALSDDQNLLTSLNCINAIFRTCSSSPTGHTFAYACLPSLSVAITQPSTENTTAILQAARTLSLYGVIDGSLDALAITIPTLLALSGSNAALARSLLSQIVAKQQENFRAVVWKMESDDRELLQKLFEQSDIHETQDSEESGDEDGQITLTSFI